MAKKLRIAFMGTPEFSVGALEALIKSKSDVVCVYTQPPRPKGRGKNVQASPVQLCAEASGIEVRYPTSFKDQADIKDFQDLNLDVAVVAAYGLILPKAILEAPQYGCINIHASLLPRWRGAAPIHRAIWAGDNKTGVTLMQMDEGLDTGDIIEMADIPISSDMTLPMLHDQLSALGASMIVPCLDRLSKNGALETTPQPDEGMTYASILKKEDGHIDWSNSSEEIDRQIRALNPWPGTWCLDRQGKRLKILAALIVNEQSTEKFGTVLENGNIVCGNDTVLKLQTVQPENKKPMDIQSALNGGYMNKGDVLS